MKGITADSLKRMLDSGEDFHLVNVLPEDSFEQKHIPGSTNVPYDEVDFVERVAKSLDDDPSRIVVYCASETCDLSPKAAKALGAAGYPNVFDFEGGVQAWEERGYPLEGSMISSSHD